MIIFLASVAIVPISAPTLNSFEVVILIFTMRKIAQQTEIDGFPWAHQRIEVVRPTTSNEIYRDKQDE